MDPAGVFPLFTFTESGLCSMSFIPDQIFYEAVAAALSNWYARSRRDLPWRRTRDPYAVLVSELMLQQTQTRRVKSYFSRWMERLPTLSDLAAAEESDVLALWQGLGYYSRARNLHRAARKLISDGHSAPVPDPVYLRTLPGLGSYTVGAVCSIAFNMPIPAVDGNVRRVFSRLLDIGCDPRKSEKLQMIENCVRRILELGQPHTLTQAFMELGATVCTPGASCRCAECPVSVFCAAKKSGTQANRSSSTRRTPIKRRLGAALLIGGSAEGYIVRRRPKDGLWAEFYEIPWLTGAENEDFDACLNRLRISLPFEGKCEETGYEEIFRFTNWHVRVRLWHAALPAEIPVGCEVVSLKRLPALPFPLGLKRLALSGLYGEPSQLEPTAAKASSTRAGTFSSKRSISS